MGPKKFDFDYHEIGRCMGILMTNLEFRKCAYMAKNRQELLRGITSFSNRSLSVILPVGEFTPDLLEPIVEWIKEQIKMKSERKTIPELELKFQKNTKLPITAQTNHSVEFDSVVYEKEFEARRKFDPFEKTGYPFGCLYYETKHRYSKYFSDIKDGLNLHCLVTFIFIFTVCFAPALWYFILFYLFYFIVFYFICGSFAGILEDKTDHWFGLNELLIATSLNGMFFALFSGQPLMIFGGI